MKKINKTQARKQYEAGNTIYLFPSKANINSPWWNGGMPINKNDQENSFDSVINSYEYYNCNNETGKIAAYYVKE
jgi:hypothetical protein